MPTVIIIRAILFKRGGREKITCNMHACILGMQEHWRRWRDVEEGVCWVRRLLPKEMQAGSCERDIIGVPNMDE